MTGWVVLLDMSPWCFVSVWYKIWVTARYTDETAVGENKSSDTEIRVCGIDNRQHHMFRHRYPAPTEESLEIAGKALVFHQWLEMEAHGIVWKYQREGRCQEFGDIRERRIDAFQWYLMGVHSVWWKFKITDPPLVCKGKMHKAKVHSCTTSQTSVQPKRQGSQLKYLQLTSDRFLNFTLDPWKERIPLSWKVNVGTVSAVGAWGPGASHKWGAESVCVGAQMENHDHGSHVPRHTDVLPSRSSQQGCPLTHSFSLLCSLRRPRGWAADCWSRGNGNISLLGGLRSKMLSDRASVWQRTHTSILNVSLPEVLNLYLNLHTKCQLTGHSFPQLQNLGFQVVSSFISLQLKWI